MIDISKVREPFYGITEWKAKFAWAEYYPQTIKIESTLDRERSQRLMAVEFLAQYFELLADRNRSVALAIAARAIPTSANTASQILLPKY